ncbi:MAG: hydrolase [Patescibacteria group bacterium]|nr:hydrolase [Patescibacteria group bacterium]
MEHADYLVDLLDPDGKIIGQKPRRAIDKLTDLYHGVHVLMITPQGEVVLGGIPRRQELPNMYTRQLGTTVAAIRRHKETAEEAGQRALEQELFLHRANVRLLGEGMVTLEDGRGTYLSAFYVIAEPPQTYSTIGIESLKVLSPDQLRTALELHPEHFAPSLRYIWKRFYDLPTDLAG